MKKYIILGFTLLLMFFLISNVQWATKQQCNIRRGVEAEAASKKKELKAGHAVAESHPYHLGLIKFAELINKKTNGQIKIDVYSNGQLGSERDMIEGLQIGTLDLLVTSTGPLPNFMPEIGVLDLPFLFRNKPHVYKVLDGDIGQSFFEKLEENNIVGLAYLENGFRHITNSKRPIMHPEDLKGIKIRTMENPVHQYMFQVLGADPTPMAWSDVFIALQQGVIDAQENPIPIIYAQKIYEVQKFLSLTGHVYSPSPLLISKKTWESLTDEQRRIFRESAIEVRDYERNLIQQQESEQLAFLKEEGLIVNKVDQNEFKNATQAVYDKYAPQYGLNLVNNIINTK